MSASTTVIHVKPEAVGDLVGFVQQVVGQPLAQPSTVTDFVSLMVQHADVLIQSAEESDAEGCFQLLFRDVQADTGNLAAHVKQLTDVLVKHAETKPALRLRILANLFNATSTTGATVDGLSLNVTLLTTIIDYAVHTNQLHFLQSYFGMLDGLVEKWALTKPDQRRLFLHVSNALESDGQAELAQKFLLKYVVTFDAGEVPTSEVDTIAKAVVGAVRNPIVSFMERHNLLGLSAVATLQNDQRHMQLFQLLRIFTEGKLREYLAFHAGNPGLLEKYGLDHEECISNMRLLSLCSLATEHEEIPYSEISNDLDVPLEEVESWVVKTIAAKLIDAKMDQLEQRVIISRCTHRMFDRAQWEQLREKLMAWQDNIRGVLSTLRKTQAHQASMSP